MGESHSEKIIREVEEGRKTFFPLFDMSDEELLNKLKEITGDEYDDFWDNKPTVRRIIENEIPNKIEIWFYNHIEISWIGIWYYPEHGAGREVRKFDKHFNL